MSYGLNWKINGFRSCSGVLVVSSATSFPRNPGFDSCRSWKVEPVWEVFETKIGWETFHLKRSTLTKWPKILSVFVRPSFRRRTLLRGTQTNSKFICSKIRQHSLSSSSSSTSCWLICLTKASFHCEHSIAYSLSLSLSLSHTHGHSHTHT